MRLDGGVDVAERAHCATELAHADRVASSAQTLAVAIDLQCPQRHLGAERGRFGVDAVRSADHHGVAVFTSESHQHAQQVVGGLQHEVACVAHHPAPCGVDHVAAGEPVVNPGAGRSTNGCLHHVDEGGNVVVGDAFAFFHCSHEVGVGGGRLCAAFGCCSSRHDANTYMRLGGEQFDFEEATETRFVAEHGCHLGERVAGNHDQIT